MIQTALFADTRTVTARSFGCCFGMPHARSKLIIFAIFAIGAGQLFGGELRAAAPRSASVVPVPSPSDEFMVQTGDIKVKFADGRTEVWTNQGNGTAPLVSSKGCVGWIEVDKSQIDLAAKNRRGVDKVVVRCMDSHRKEFQANPEAPFIGNWRFLYNGTAVVIQSSGHHGPRFYRKYDADSGTLIAEIDTYTPYRQLPGWAKQLADQRD